jgi:hypothetical protein
MSARRHAGALASASVEARVHQSFIIRFRQLTVHRETKSQLRIGGGDSRKKPVLANGDAAGSR